MTGATVCSGIGAPETAMPWVKWLWCAEIEKFPSAVLAHRHPASVNPGDIAAADFIERAIAFGPIDLLVAGTPCQAFSVAGNRQSLKDERGNLTLRFVEIVDAINPGAVLWENVPGVLSTKDNAFGCFLAALVGADASLVPVAGWTHAGMVSGPRRNAAWRTLDAQYFGLAQRRRRVFVVACPRNGANPAEILFEFESVRWDSPPSREAGQGFTHDVAPSLTNSGRGVERGGDTRGQDPGSDRSSHLIASTGEISHCLNAGGMGRIDYETETLITHALRADGFDASEDGTGRGTQLVPVVGAGLTANAVRRLTPRECERLQGFPDDYTLAPYQSKPAADGPRYKALGNSMAVPVIAWLGKRIATSLKQASEAVA